MAVVLTVTFGAIAAAHVGPSKDDNNRYLKLTLQADRIRLAYTVFFGEVPGAKLRGSIDADHDGTISEPEAQAFGDKLADEVAAAIDVNVDTTQVRVHWEQVVVGMGSPQVRAGSFSVDLVTQLCLGPGATHALVLRDRFRLLNPGETEVKLEDTTGITVLASKIGTATDRDVKFVGPGGPLSDDGVQLSFEVTARAPSASSACTVPAPSVPPASGLPAALVVISGAVVAFALALIVTLIKRRRR